MVSFATSGTEKRGCDRKNGCGETQLVSMANEEILCRTVIPSGKLSNTCASVLQQHLHSMLGGCLVSYTQGGSHITKLGSAILVRHPAKKTLNQDNERGDLGRNKW